MAIPAVLHGSPSVICKIDVPSCSLLLSRGLVHTRQHPVLYRNALYMSWMRPRMNGGLRFCILDQCFIAEHAKGGAPCEAISCRPKHMVVNHISRGRSTSGIVLHGDQPPQGGHAAVEMNGRELNSSDMAQLMRLTGIQRSGEGFGSRPCRWMAVVQARPDTRSGRRDFTGSFCSRCF